MNALINFEKSHEQYMYVWCMQFRKVSFYLRENKRSTWIDLICTIEITKYLVLNFAYYNKSIKWYAYSRLVLWLPHVLYNQITYTIGRVIIHRACKTYVSGSE